MMRIITGFVLLLILLTTACSSSTVERPQESASPTQTAAAIPGPTATEVVEPTKTATALPEPTATEDIEPTETPISADPIAAQVNAPFRINYGQSAIFEKESLTITFDSVLEDNRCPRSLDCGEAGSIKIGIIVQEAGQDAVSYEMNPDPELVRAGWPPNIVTHSDFEIKLLEVNPHPEVYEDLKDLSSLSATYIVSKS